MKKIFLLCLLTISITVTSQTQVKEEEAIRAVLKMQQDAWNQNDLEGFMQGYWKSDSLKFYGSKGITSGWEYTGTLSFTIETITKIEENSYYVMGQFHLVRDLGNANGVFLIIFRKIEGEWKIIADLSC